MSKNPYAEADGTPKKGFELAFLDWAVANDKKRIDELPSKEKAEAIKSAQHLKDKMES